MSPTEQPKVCASCGADVSAGQRMKDAQGRYICIPCVDKLRARKRESGAKRVTNIEGSRATAAGIPPSSDQGADLREFMVQAQQAAKNQCPSCGAFAPPDAVICLSCGYDSRTQGQIQTKFGRARAPKGGGGGGSGGDAAILDHQYLAGGLAALWVLMCTALPLWLAFGAKDLDTAPLATAPNALAAFVIWICWLVSYFQRNGAGKGVLVTIVTLIFLPIGELIACAYFNKEGPNRLFRLFAAAVAVSILASVIVSAYTVYQTVSSEMQLMDSEPSP